MTHVCAWAGQNCQGFMQIVNSVALEKVKIRERVAKVAAKVSAKKYLRVNRKVKRVLGTADIGLARK